jgi:hypothetical protein
MLLLDANDDVQIALGQAAGYRGRPYVADLGGCRQQRPQR